MRVCKISIDEDLYNKISVACFLNSLSKKDFFLKVLNYFFRNNPNPNLKISPKVLNGPLGPNGPKGPKVRI